MIPYDVIIDSSVRTDYSGYSQLARIYSDVIAQNNKDVRIVFNQCPEFDSNLAAVLGSILMHLKAQGYNVQLTTPISVRVRRSLSRCKFLKAFDIPSHSMDKENYLEYMVFTSAESNLFKQYIDEQLMQKQKFPAHSKKAGELIQELIFEIFVNAIEHGKCEFIFCCGEYFPVVSPPMLYMTIVDRGDTIKGTVNNYMERRGTPQNYTSVEAIHWAMQEGHTTKDWPGGLGLARLRKFVKANQGAIQIVSDNGMVEYTTDTYTDQILDYPFEGTIVTMKFNFNDDQNYYIASEECYDTTNLL